MEIFVALIVGFLTSIAYYVFVKRKTKSGAPTEWPFVGMFPSFFMHLKDFYDWQSQILARCEGTYIFKGPSPIWCAVLTSDPANVEYILKTKFSSFPKGRIFTSVFRDLLGHGIFNVDGELWIQQRKASMAEFNSSSSLAYVLESVQDSVGERLIPVLDDACSKHKSIDLQDVFLRFAFDNICKIAFGVEVGCLSPSLPATPFLKAFEDATEASALRFVTPICLRKIMRRAGLGIDVKLRSDLKIIDQFAMEIVSARREELGRISDKRADILSIFMQSRDKNGVLYSDTFLRDICISFILAGRDTSSVALSWFFWLLLQHPHVEENILEEIHGILKDRPVADHHGPYNSPVCFSREELKKMSYMHACLAETMRLYPPVPVDRKQAIEDEVLPDGTPIKKGTSILYMIYAMGRMESIWGKDCLEFKPERWLDDEGSFVSQSVYKYPVFNAGPRMCLGKDFAYLQMKHAAASILHRFIFKLVNEDDQRVRYKIALTLYMKKGLCMTLQPRRSMTRDSA